MMTLQQIEAETKTINARLAEVDAELAEDRKSEGAKRERKYLRQALKNLAKCARIVIEINATKKLLADMQPAA